MTLKELLSSKKIPEDIILSKNDLRKLVIKYKGLLKDNERNKAFWESTNKNLERVTLELDETNKKLVETRDQLWGEMQLAKKIQTVLLPKNSTIDGYKISTYMQPADEVGGDYYDIINFEGADWIIIGDVSGHGVPAGLIMMMVQTAIHTVLIHNPTISPPELLDNINKIIKKNISRLGENRYMTITVFAQFKNGIINFSGVHQDILIYRSKQKQIETICTDGMWIGILDDIKPILSNRNFKLDIDDVLLIFTDGVIESWEKNDKTQAKMFSQERLIDILKKNGKLSPNEIKIKILQELENFCCDDDITFVILKMTG